MLLKRKGEKNNFFFWWFCWDLRSAPVKHHPHPSHSPCPADTTMENSWDWCGITKTGSSMAVFSLGTKSPGFAHKIEYKIIPASYTTVLSEYFIHFHLEDFFFHSFWYKHHNSVWLDVPFVYTKGFIWFCELVNLVNVFETISKILLQYFYFKLHGETNCVFMVTLTFSDQIPINLAYWKVFIITPKLLITCLRCVLLINRWHFLCSIIVVQYNCRKLINFN